MMKFIKKRVLTVVSLFLVLTLLPVLPKTMAASQGKMISQTREQLDAERYIVTTLYDTTTAPARPVQNQPTITTKVPAYGRLRFTERFITMERPLPVQVIP